MIELDAEVRRAPHLVWYWKNGRRQCVNHATGMRVEVGRDVVAFLDTLSDWTTCAQVAADLGASFAAEDVGDVLTQLRNLGLIEVRGAERARELWEVWAPEAALFHFATRNAPYPVDRATAKAAVRERARHHPPPAATKQVDGVRLRPARANVPEGFASVLRARRTWRRFSPAPIAAGAVAALLELTSGVQAWADAAEEGTVAVKTSPSAGARHPIETYLLAWNVADIPAGVYHYDAAERALVILQKPFNATDVGPLLAHQHHFAQAGAAVVFTAVFERTMWKYPFARAYRAVLIDAGHLCQSFCLTATALGLAPFCTMAFYETPLEALLGIDGVTESALYVAGVGSRPDGIVENPGFLAAEWRE